MLCWECFMDLFLNFFLHFIVVFVWIVMKKFYHLWEMKWLMWLEVLGRVAAQFDTVLLLRQREKFSCEMVEYLVVGAWDFIVAFDDIVINYLGFVKECAWEMDMNGFFGVMQKDKNVFCLGMEIVLLGGRNLSRYCCWWGEFRGSWAYKICFYK